MIFNVLIVTNVTVKSYFYDIYHIKQLPFKIILQC
jgi:hypothetical protein